MLKETNNKYSLAIILAFSLYVLMTLIYIQFGKESEWKWWAFDKIKDRLLVMNMLFVSFFIVKDSTYKLILSIFVVYVFWYAVFEVSYIRQLSLKQDITVSSDTFMRLSALYFFAIALIALVVFLVKNKNNY